MNDDGFLLADIIFTLKDLRNAIAHNGIIFDTRFATVQVPNRIKRLLEQEMGIKTLDFNYIVSYLALVVYLLFNMGETKRCRSTVHEFLTLHVMLEKMPVGTKMQIKGTEHDTVIRAMGKLLNVDFKC